MIVRGAKVIVRDTSDCILIVRRSSTHQYVPLTNDLPGGQVEAGETMVEGLIRELSEETGISVDLSKLTLLASNKTKNFYGKDYEIELYELVVDSRPVITTSFEHDSYSWVPLKQASIVGQLYEQLLKDYIANA